jgi:hypothetical protein
VTMTSERCLNREKEPPSVEVVTGTYIHLPLNFSWSCRLVLMIDVHIQLDVHILYILYIQYYPCPCSATTLRNTGYYSLSGPVDITSDWTIHVNILSALSYTVPLGSFTSHCYSLIYPHTCINQPLFTWHLYNAYIGSSVLSICFSVEVFYTRGMYFTVITTINSHWLNLFTTLSHTLQDVWYQCLWPGDVGDVYNEHLSCCAPLKDLTHCGIHSFQEIRTCMSVNHRWPT